MTVKIDSTGNVVPLLLRRPQVRQLTNLSDRQIDRLEREGSFPRRVKINPAAADAQQAAVGWSAAEIEQWCADLLASRDGVMG